MDNNSKYKDEHSDTSKTGTTCYKNNHPVDNIVGLQFVAPANRPHTRSQPSQFSPVRRLSAPIQRHLCNQYSSPHPAGRTNQSAGWYTFHVANGWENLLCQPNREGFQ